MDLSTTCCRPVFEAAARVEAPVEFDRIWAKARAKAPGLGRGSRGPGRLANRWGDSQTAGPPRPDVATLRALDRLSGGGR